jgi:hypothetical protein
MSSETSTDPSIDANPRLDDSGALYPWHLFTLAGLVGATVVVFLSKGQSPAAVILLSLTIFAAAAVGLAGLRTFVPLAGEAVEGPRTAPRASRTRAALEREKALVLRSIKEIEFDRAMGKMSEKDFVEMSARLRQRAARLMRELDAGAGYREQIEREITRRVAGVAPAAGAGPASPGAVSRASGDGAGTTADAPASVCASCQTANDTDARFCKGCGAKLGTES